MGAAALTLLKEYGIPPGGSVEIQGVAHTIKAVVAPIAMLVGEIFLETMSTGVITQEEINWLTTHQASFNRDEEAKALRIGRLLDEGEIQIGCRLLGRQSA